MTAIKMELVDNDQVVRVKTDLAPAGTADPLRTFIDQIREELLPGQTAYLEISGNNMKPLTFEISPLE